MALINEGIVSRKEPSPTTTRRILSGTSSSSSSSSTSQPQARPTSYYVRRRRRRSTSGTTPKTTSPTPSTPSTSSTPETAPEPSLDSGPSVDSVGPSMDKPVLESPKPNEPSPTTTRILGSTEAPAKSATEESKQGVREIKERRAEKLEAKSETETQKLDDLIKDMPDPAKEKVKQAAQEGATIKVYSGEAPHVDVTSVSPAAQYRKQAEEDLMKRSTLYSLGARIQEGGKVVGEYAGKIHAFALGLKGPVAGLDEQFISGWIQTISRSAGLTVQSAAGHELMLKREKISPLEGKIIGEKYEEARHLMMESFAMEGVAKVARVGAEVGAKAGGRLVDVASPYVKKGVEKTVVTTRLARLTVEKKISDLAWRVSEPLYQKGILKAETENVPRTIKNPFKTYRMIQEGISSKGQGLPVERAQGKFTREELRSIFETADKIKQGVSSKGQGMDVMRAQGKFTREELNKIFSDTKRSGLRRLIREHLSEERRKFWEHSEIKDISASGETASIKAVRKGKRTVITHEEIPAEKIPEWKWLDYEKQGDFGSLRGETPKLRKKPSKSFDFDRDLTRRLRERWKERETRYELESKKGGSKLKESKSKSGLKTVQIQKEKVEPKVEAKPEIKGTDLDLVNLKRRRKGYEYYDYDYPPPEHLIAERGGVVRGPGSGDLLRVGMGILGGGAHNLAANIERNVNTNQIVSTPKPDLGIKTFDLMGPKPGIGQGQGNAQVPRIDLPPSVTTPPFTDVTPKQRTKPKTITGEPSLPGLTPKQTPGEVTTPKTDTITDVIEELIPPRGGRVLKFNLVFEKPGRKMIPGDIVGVRFRHLTNVYGDIFMRTPMFKVNPKFNFKMKF